MVAAMPGSNDRDPYPEAQERRRRAITAFLDAGMHDPPSRALAVQALADARRSVAAHRARNEPIDRWLASEVRFRGIRETLPPWLSWSFPSTARTHRSPTPADTPTASPSSTNCLPSSTS
jgi:hypothetical protein